MPFFGIAPDDAVALEAAHELGEQERAAVRPRHQRLERDGGDVLHGMQQLARELGRRVRREGAELEAHVRRAALAPARLHLREPGPRQHADPQRRLAPPAWSRTRSPPGSRRPRSGRRRGSAPAGVPARGGEAPRRRCGSPSRAARRGRRRARAARAPRASSTRARGPRPATARRRARRAAPARCRRASRPAARSSARAARAGSLRSRRRSARAPAARRRSVAGRDAPQLLDQPGAQVRLAEPALGDDRRQAGPPLPRCDARAARPSSRSISSLRPTSGACDDTHDRQRVVLARRRQRRDQAAVRQRLPAPLGDEIAGRGGEEQPLAADASPAAFAGGRTRR